MTTYYKHTTYLTNDPVTGLRAHNMYGHAKIETLHKRGAVRATHHTYDMSGKGRSNSDEVKL